MSTPLSLVPGGLLSPPAGTGAAPDATTIAAWRPVAGRLHSWDLSTGVDGPGTRFVAFTAGCPLRCLYCQNPDTWRMREGMPTTAGELVERVAGYRRFIEVAGGGFTVSGGEPLLQPAFTRAVLTGVKELGLHTALDTSGFLGARADDALLAATDLVLLDIKSWDRSLYRRLTGAELGPTLAFARRLAALGTPVWLRYVLVPGLTDPVDNVAGVAAFAATLGNVERVDVLPFHRAGGGQVRAAGAAVPARGRGAAGRRPAGPDPAAVHRRRAGGRVAHDRVLPEATKMLADARPPGPTPSGR